MSTTPRRRTFDSPEQEVYLGLWRTYERLRRVEDELFASYELTAQQYNALRLLKSARPAGLPTLALASRLISRSPDITRLLDRLEQRGLIAREQQPDNRRRVIVSITRAGLDLLRRMDGQVRECAREQLGHLSDAQKTQLIELLRAARLPHEEEGSEWSEP